MEIQLKSSLKENEVLEEQLQKEKEQHKRGNEKKRKGGEKV